ncbi:MAG: hypothetical protein PHD36_09570 [Desulfotomaculaceae bacterium]|nr:hypothetical protein [Desulfotomaculaceae bacterium]
MFKHLFKGKKLPGLAFAVLALLLLTAPALAVDVINEDNGLVSGNTRCAAQNIDLRGELGQSITAAASTVMLLDGGSQKDNVSGKGEDYD